MYLRFEPSGTHVKRNIKTDEYSLLVRLDWIPSETDAAYKVHHVYVPVIGDKVYTGKVDEMGSPIDSDDYQKWLDSLPHIWRVNPCLGEFITVPETVCKEDIDAWAELKLDRDTPATLNKMWDDYRTGKLDRAISHSISPYFRDRGKYTTQKVLTKDYVDLVASVNQRLCPDLIPITKALTSDGVARTVEPESIDVGPGATDRASALSPTYTRIDLNNPANATGTLDTFEIWFHSTGAGVKVGTTFLVSGSTYECRDSYPWGNVASGSKQTATGLSVAVQTDDLAAHYFSDGQIEYDSSGNGTPYISGDSLTAETQFATSLGANRTTSIYATGTESGGGSTYEHSITDSLSATDTIRGQKIYQAAVIDNMTGSDAGGRAYVALPSVTDIVNIGSLKKCGFPPVTGDTAFSPSSTLINLVNPCQGSGVVSRVRLTLGGPSSNVLVGMFYLVSGTTYRCRVGTSIGSVSAGTTTQIVNLPYQDGDFIGLYVSGTNPRGWSSGGSGVMYKFGNYCSTDSETSFYLLSGRTLSLQGIEDISFQANVNVNHSVADIVSALDSIVNGFSYFHTLSDIAAHSDSLLHEFSMNPTVSDSVHIGMTPTAQLNGNNSIVDITHLLETLVGSRVGNNTLTDNLTANDLTTAGLSYLESVVDSLTLSDKPWAARWLAILLSLAKHHRLTITPDNQLAITHLIELPLKLTQTVKDEA